MAIEVNQRTESSEEDGEVDVEESTSNGDISSTTSSGPYDPIQTGTSDEDEDVDLDSDEDTDDKGDARAKVLSVLELEDLFLASAPDLSGKSRSVADGSSPYNVRPGRVPGFFRKSSRETGRWSRGVP